MSHVQQTAQVDALPLFAAVLLTPTYLRLYRSYIAWVGPTALLLCTKRVSGERVLIML